MPRHEDIDVGILTALTQDFDCDFALWLGWLSCASGQVIDEMA